MPTLSDPPNTAPIAGQNYAGTHWLQWFTQLKGVLTGRAFYIPAVSGAPTFTPEVRPGYVPMVYDLTNDKLYVYNGSWVASGAFT